KVQRDHPAHRKANQMRPLRIEVIEYAPEVANEVVHGQGTLIVIAFPIAARIPRHRVEVISEYRKLVVPIGTIAADPVKEDRKRSRADVIDCDSRWSRHEDGRVFRHPLTPSQFAETRFPVSV